jgi:hypothetical protein
VSLQPVTFRPITAVKPVSRQADEESVRKVADPKRRPRRGRRLDPGQGENLDTWV